MTISFKHSEILEKRGLDIELLERMFVESGDKLGPDTVMIPYYRGDQVVGRKYRTIAGDKKFTQEKGSEQILYNLNVLADDTLDNEPLIITEGEIDCWSALQAGFPRTVSVPGGAPSVAVGERAGVKYDFLRDVPDTAREIVLAVDADDPGAALRGDLATRLGERRCKWVKYPVGCKDLNDALRRYGLRGVQESIRRAQWLVGNAYAMSEVPPIPYAKPHDSGFPGLDKHWRLRLGDLTIVTGIPGHGKSTFVGDIACRMASRHQWPVCFASFEQYPTLDQRRSLRSWHGGGSEHMLDEDTLRRADQWIEEYFTFLVPDLKSYVTFPWIMERFAAVHARRGARLFIIDPWNELEHDRPREVTMTEYVGQCLRDIKAFCRHYESHVIVCAHPAKLMRDGGKVPMPSLYDIADSAHWINKADVGIIVYREGGDDKQATIRVAKSRHHSEIGTPGDVEARYVWQRATYESVTNYTPDPRIPD